jgi:hypothetical protein
VRRKEIWDLLPVGALSPHGPVICKGHTHSLKQDSYELFIRRNAPFVVLRQHKEFFSWFQVGHSEWETRVPVQLWLVSLLLISWIRAMIKLPGHHRGWLGPLALLVEISPSALLSCWRTKDFTCLFPGNPNKQISTKHLLPGRNIVWLTPQP